MQTIPRPIETEAKSDVPETVVRPPVCLVDDDASVRKAVGRLLKSAGFEVEAFATPESFLEYLAKHPVFVVILDVWMDTMTGMELLAQLCAKSPATRVIFVTGEEDHTAQLTAMQAGAFGFLVKPFDDVEFVVLVRRALDQLPARRKLCP
jgi:FixJ family two-component response regulator